MNLKRFIKFLVSRVVDGYSPYFLFKTGMIMKNCFYKPL